ncbi:protein toll-like [Mytilus californianus]|uniref:protein toll-like n=1 Tax=Mytilus californianus TaxID=6549 RepID=UPI0022473E73|nr:protein toll-like [Mytilus californianus]XP_052099754.1 protein toll-like [Mytilus californianus]
MNMHLLSLFVVLLQLVLLVSGRCSDSTATNIVMSNLGITEIDESLFEDCNPQAISIDLSGNQITHINATAFASYDGGLSQKYIPLFYQLKTLNLNDNQINSIDPNAFKYTKVLETLNMKNNQLQSLESEVFDPIGDTLVTLVVSSNQIASIGMSMFSTNLKTLRNVDLSYNKMTYMEAWPYIPPSIITFNLSYNDVNEFTNRLNWTYDLQEPYHAYVDLRYNKFARWDDEWFRRYQKPNGDFVGDFVTYRLDITKNNWTCDCHMHYMASKIQDSFYRYAESELLHVECGSPPNLSGQRLMNVDLNEFNCDVVNCSFGCKCTNISETKILQVDCMNGNLIMLPMKLPDIPDRTITLDVSNNSIWKIDPRPYVDQLVKLNAANNKLVFIDQETVKNMTQSKLSMNISNNNLNFLPNSIQNVQSISIYNNPFICDCNMTWMKGWLELDSIVEPDKSVTCKTTEGDVHKIVDVTESLLDCNYDTEIGLAVGFGILLILVVIGIVWAKRCPYETKVLVFKFFRIHPSDKYKIDEEVKSYDAYISFDDENIHIRQWVTRKLKKRLEEKKQELFIPVINLQIGEEKADQIVKSMENSKRVIIILSDKYDENEWSVFECQQAEMLNPNDGRIIFIKYHPEAEDMVQKEPWKSRVKDRKVLAIGEKSSEHRWFWDKLKYELPVK